MCVCQLGSAFGGSRKDKPQQKRDEWATFLLYSRLMLLIRRPDGAGSALSVPPEMGVIKIAKVEDRSAAQARPQDLS